MKRYPIEKKIYDSLSKRQKHYLYYLLSLLGFRRWFLRMDLNADCNLKCRMCYMSRPGIKPERDDMTLELLTKIAVEMFPKTRYLYLSCGYEPLLAEHFEQALEFSRKYKVPYVSFSTNGAAINRRWVEKFIACKTTEILFSIDAATEETFKKIRGISLKKLLEKIEMIRCVKRESKIDYPLIRFNFTMMRSNLEEIPLYLDMAHRAGVEIIQLRHVMDFGNLPDFDFREQGLKYHRELTNNILDMAREKSRKLGIYLDAPDNFDLSKPVEEIDSFKEDYTESSCFYPWFQAVIDSDGQVQPCSHWKDEPLGNLTNAAFKELFEEKYKPLQKSLLEENLPFSCRTCPSCGGDKRPDA